MAIQSRMEKNKKLHEEVKKDIVYNRQLQNDKSIIYSAFERLKEIDFNFFKDKLTEFDKKHQFEKPYLDKDSSSSFLPDELKYELKREIAELKKINENSLISENEYNSDLTNEVENISLKNEKYIRYLNNLNLSQQNFQKNIEKLKNKQSKGFNAAQDISMTTVQQMRTQDKRPTHHMLVDVQEKVEKSQAKVLKSYVSKVKKRGMKWVIPILVVIILIMMVSILVPVFIDF
ncbi:hypothetical protein SLITO_v1c08340 [Spiroplasma litorale]|uniref:Uncharacterized protein n=1 Tax=Spiroplasma litorale TaxID=216942 RepID=A0A0K1W293_9MOLU|nr:hypothetical protein [Spiroplasma litorale]AKX34449.1 hypothetical protein SLITO_v1c08340 [Spiroplasma litorale]